MPVRYPGLDWLVDWAASSPPAVGVGNLYKDELQAAAIEWYATTFPERYPNTINEMIYAYLLDNYQASLGGGD